jgi:hypothetical protein
MCAVEVETVGVEDGTAMGTVDGAMGDTRGARNREADGMTIGIIDGAL